MEPNRERGETRGGGKGIRRKRHDELVSGKGFWVAAQGGSLESGLKRIEWRHRRNQKRKTCCDGVQGREGDGGKGKKKKEKG